MTHLLPTRNTPDQQRYTRLKVTGWRKIFLANGKKKPADVAILISDKTDFNPKTENETEASHD